MRRFEGATARQLDFGEITTTATLGARARGNPGLRLAGPAAAGPGPDKYRLIEQRRRRAQIRARHLLDLVEGSDA